MFLICVLLFAVFVGLIAWMIDWSVHISMNKDQNKPYNWCSFKTFKKEFDKYKGNPKLYIRKFDDYSIFVHGTYSSYIVYLHASIIQFNGKCMILYPCSWLRYCIWKRNFAKSHRQREICLNSKLL